MVLMEYGSQADTPETAITWKVIIMPEENSPSSKI